MSMSKKDYEVIASIAKGHYNAHKHHECDVVSALDSLLDSMADHFKRDNSRFQKDRFLEAATPDWHRKTRGLPPVKRTPSRVSGLRPKPEGF